MLKRVLPVSAFFHPGAKDIVKVWDMMVLWFQNDRTMYFPALHPLSGST